MKITIGHIGRRSQKSISWHTRTAYRPSGKIRQGAPALKWTLPPQTTRRGLCRSSREVCFFTACSSRPFTPKVTQNYGSLDEPLLQRPCPRRYAEAARCLALRPAVGIRTQVCVLSFPTFNRLPIAASGDRSRRPASVRAGFYRHVCVICRRQRHVCFTEFPCFSIR